MANPVRIKYLSSIRVAGITTVRSRARNVAIVIKRRNQNQPLLAFAVHTFGGFYQWYPPPSYEILFTNDELPVIECNDISDIDISITMRENNKSYVLDGKIIRNLSLHRESSGSAYRVGAVDLLSGQLCPSEID